MDEGRKKGLDRQSGGKKTDVEVQKKKIKTIEFNMPESVH